MRISSLVIAAFTVVSLSVTALAVDVGQAAPNFTLTDQNGKTVKRTDLAGKVIVLEWFNNGCPFVGKQYKTGAMNATAAKYAAKGVIWLAVNSTFSATTSTNAEAAKAWKIDRPILDDHAGVVGHAYGATNTPHMFVIDATGKIAYAGAIDSNDSPDPADLDGATNYVAVALDSVLAGKPVAQSKTAPYGCTVKYAK